MRHKDIASLCLYQQALEPVVEPGRENQLQFPFDQCTLLAGWKALFHDAASYAPDRRQSAERNRGAYLVGGTGHCRIHGVLRIERAGFHRPSDKRRGTADELHTAQVMLVGRARALALPPDVVAGRRPAAIPQVGHKGLAQQHAAFVHLFRGDVVQRGGTRARHAGDDHRRVNRFGVEAGIFAYGVGRLRPAPE